MCMSVYYKGQQYSSVGELCRLVGRDNVVASDGQIDPDGNCLCNIDFAETAWNFNCNAYTDGVEVEFVPFGEKPKWGDRLMERRPVDPRQQRLAALEELAADAQANGDGY